MLHEQPMSKQLIQIIWHELPFHQNLQRNCKILSSKSSVSLLVGPGIASDSHFALRTRIRSIFVGILPARTCPTRIPKNFLYACSIPTDWRRKLDLS
jgi:hypothetical protein